MPGYRAHLAGGVVSFLVVIATCVSLVSIPLAIEWLVFALLGSLFPDIDTKSKGQRVFYYLIAGVYCIVLIQSRWMSLALLTGIALLPLLVHHRGLFHKFWFIVSVALVGMVYCYACMPSMASTILLDGIFFVAGAASHLILDRGWRRAFRF